MAAEEVKVEEKKSVFDDSVSTPAVGPSEDKVMDNPYLELLGSIPEFQSLGPLFKSVYSPVTRCTADSAADHARQWHSRKKNRSMS